MSIPLLGAGRSSPAVWTPASLADLAAWYKADGSLYQQSDGTTPATGDGDPVGYWYDESGNGRHCIQADAAKKPTLQLAELNGLPVVRADGTDDLLNCFGAAINSPYSIYAVARFANFDAAEVLAAGAFGDPIIYGQATTGIFVAYSGAPGALTKASMSAGTAYTVQSTHDGASSSVSLNGGTKTTGTLGGTGFNAFTNGLYLFSDLGNFGSVDLAELVITSAALSAGDEASLFAYLRAKWGHY